MCSSGLAINSAALWHFLTRMTAKERAECLGAYTEVLAMAGQEGTVGEAAVVDTDATTGEPKKGKGRGTKKG